MIENKVCCFIWAFGIIKPEGWSYTAKQSEKYNQVRELSDWDLDEDGCPYKCGFPEQGWSKTVYGWELVFFPLPWEDPTEAANRLLGPEQEAFLASM